MEGEAYLKIVEDSIIQHGYNMDRYKVATRKVGESSTLTQAVVKKNSRRRMKKLVTTLLFNNILSVLIKY